MSTIPAAVATPPASYGMPPRLVGPGFVLRTWSVSDAPALQRTLDASAAHLRAWTPWVVDGRIPGQSLEARLLAHAEAFAAGREWVYGIFSDGDGDILGGCGLYPRVGPRALEIGYWLAVAHTGRGLATASARILTEAAFATPNIDRVEMHVEAANVASSGVPRRLGYRALAPAPVAPDPALGAPQLITWVLTRDELAGAFNQTIPT